MPGPGDQHQNAGGRPIVNPFEEVKPRISEYTVQEIMTLQSRLEKQLGPEYISSRAGPSGQKVHYIAAEKCIQLANEVFGFNGWSSQIMDVQVDFVDENPTTLKVSLGLSVIVRVTLRDGTFHEDVGYGHMENSKGKAAAFEKAKKEGTTDGLKRALRNFGNCLGNCIYDKEYLQKVTKIKMPAAKFDVEKLYRHSTFIPPVVAKREESKVMVEEKQQSVTTGPSLSTEESIEDEFGDFDEADFGVADPDSHPDEVTLPAPTANSRYFNDNRSNNAGGPPHRNHNQNHAQNQNQSHNQNQSRPVTRQQSMAAPSRPQNTGPTNGNQPPPAQPQTPKGGFSRPTNGAGRGMQPPQEIPLSHDMQPGPPPMIHGRVLNQPSRTSMPPSAPVSPAQPESNEDSKSVGLPAEGTGFFSARGVTMLPEPLPEAPMTGPPARIPAHLPAFDPHAESPSIPRTPGIDHKSSKPLTRDGKHAPKNPQAASNAGPVITNGLPANGGFAAASGGARTGFNGHQMDGPRRVGAPVTPSPHANRSSYKPPTVIKRPMEPTGGRTPLVDLPANGAMGAGGGGDIIGGGDAKRQRLNG